MKNLPVAVADEDIEEMFEFADKNKDGKLSYEEFLVTNCFAFLVSNFQVFRFSCCLAAAKKPQYIE